MTDTIRKKGEKKAGVDASRKDAKRTEQSVHLFAHESIDHGIRCAVGDWAPEHGNTSQQKVESDCGE